jgi:hypothetical protein
LSAAGARIDKVSDELGRAAIHEAGHLAIALACGRRPGPVAIRPDGSGRSFHSAPMVSRAVIEGADLALPFVLWPAVLRARFESDVLTLMAGQVAEELFAPRTGRQPEPVAEAAAELAAALPELAGPNAGEQQAVGASFASFDPDDTDEARIAKAARAAFGSDIASAACWLAWMAAQTRALVLGNGSRIRQLAELLGEHGTIGGQAAETLLAAG